MRPSQVNLNQVVKELLIGHRSQLAQRDLTLVAELDAGLERRPLTTDRALVAKALNYLLDNALRYTPQAGCITLTTAAVAEADSRWLTVAVQNSGPGISPEEMAHLFERFYRGEAARDYKNPGAGLGLAISRAIVNLLNGRLTVNGNPGHGVTFILWLPENTIP